MCTICHFLTTLVPFFSLTCVSSSLVLFVFIIIIFFVVIKKKEIIIVLLFCVFFLYSFLLLLLCFICLFHTSHYYYYYYYYYYFGAHLPLACAHFKKKKIEVFIHNFFNNKMCYFFVLVNEGIIINLYQLHFLSSYFFSQSNKTILIPSLFHLSNQIHTRRN